MEVVKPCETRSKRQSGSHGGNRSRNGSRGDSGGESEFESHADFVSGSEPDAGRDSATEPRKQSRADRPADSCGLSRAESRRECRADCAGESRGGFRTDSRAESSCELRTLPSVASRASGITLASAQWRPAHLRVLRCGYSQDGYDSRIQRCAHGWRRGRISRREMSSRAEFLHSGSRGPSACRYRRDNGS